MMLAWRRICLNITSDMYEALIQIKSIAISFNINFVTRAPVAPLAKKICKI